MLEKFLLWFITFGLSFGLQRLGWAEQGEAFCYLMLGMNSTIIIVVAFISLLLGDGVLEKLSFPLIMIILYTAEIFIIVIATWGATQLFQIDFFIAYQIMTFGQCLCRSKSSTKS